MESEGEITHVLNKQLNSVNKTTRNTLALCFKDKLFTPVYDISLRNQKELALERLKKVMSTKVVSISDFLKDPDNIFTVHEMV
jgi:acyl-CoA oxidase